MVEKGINKGSYERTGDNNLQDLKRVPDFLHRNFYNYENYHKMYLHSNQPATLYETAKTHQKDKIKFRPTIDQTRTYT